MSTKQRIGSKGVSYNEEQYKFFLDHIPAVSWATTSDGETLFISANVEQIFGYTPEDILGKGSSIWFDNIHPDDERAVKDHFRLLFKDGTPFSVEYRLKRKDGTWIWIHDQASLVEEKEVKKVAYGVFTDITKRKIAEKNIQEAIAEKDVLLKEVHHRVKNNLQIIVSLMNLQVAYMTDPEATSLCNDMKDRIKSMAMVHESLYRSKSMANISIDEYIKNLATMLFASHKSRETVVKLEHDLQPLQLDIEKAVPCGLITNELITNALKHAFPHGKKGVVKLALREADGRITINVSDDGVGIPAGEDPENSDSLGLRLVFLLTKQIGGEAKMSSEGGVKWHIEFPL